MSKSTPGPWEATDDGDIRAFIPEYGCRMSLIGDGEIAYLADAKLMAAAPDLLAMLREAMGWLGDASAYNGTSGGDDFNDRYSALMKKIEGE